MELNTAFGLILRQARKVAGKTQEDFSEVSGRTYLSALERGLQSPTLEKLDDLSRSLQIHPVSLLAASYLIKDCMPVDDLLIILKRDLRALGVEGI
ncbi:helix-turn-helix protein [compost metagenome]|jgi:transcriptional regulator with XRE-family HTH domain|uniref:helix-turn-helix domain-containing protein n=1 Tax=Pseudomonas taiwanensis TaxID=470150 RepID=UPI000F9F5241|nr:helix-turn-helix transcriptional regulator [Pseudomonas taiwanensis]NWL80918.1 transcriptional regulator [Pseudomonas taiwanensis]